MKSIISRVNERPRFISYKLALESFLKINKCGINIELCLSVGEIQWLRPQDSVVPTASSSMFKLILPLF